MKSLQPPSMSNCTVLCEKQNQARDGLQECDGAEQNPGLLAVSGAVGKVDHLFRMQKNSLT